MSIEQEIVELLLITGRDAKRKYSISIRFRYPISGNVYEVKKEINKMTKEWLKERVSTAVEQSDET